ncbi:protein kinase [Streptomyces hygroscopicus]|uniref:serine/threonine-protein kinase n=1 Tax=Streptomyces hygroscopicus TaxID=1912 RepID=UPI002240619C|nr:serine/threonine-protein kinase [Streptomyces hygroscopicus]MCW7945715.1 protein kinase [Streptomyces hygroscopicus]
MRNEDIVPGGPGSERVVAGRYRLLTALGEGGMGTVWRARDEVLHREVAIKEVRAPAGLSVADVERMYTRLEREAWAAARIPDRNVVTVYDVATDGGRPWIVMELVRGQSLADLLRTEGPLTPQRAAHLGAEVLSALRAAHAAGVLHRDVKPANVLLANDGRVVLTDFGIAMVEGSSALTMTGEVVGSPEYLPPERALGRTPGPESDLWSLGVLLYAAVEGSTPFRQDTPLSTLRAVVDAELPPPRQAGPLTPVIEGLLRKDPGQRIPAEQAEQALRNIGAGGKPPTEPTPETTNAPTVVAHPRTQPSAAHQAPTGPAVAAPAIVRPPRNRRTTLVPVAAAAACALVVIGLGYTLVGRGGGNGLSANQSPAGASSSRTLDGVSQDAGHGSAPAGQDEEQNTPASQAVRVTVTGSNTAYTGACPSPSDQAPTFTATFAVGRVPAQISYRWVSKDGSVVDRSWRILSFAGDGDRTGQDTVHLTTHSGTGTLESEIGVEVRGPLRTTSNTVPFSVTCRD